MITGSCILEEDNLRINFELNSINENQIVWAETYYIDDFKIPNITGVGLLKNKVPKWLDNFVDGIIKPKPVINYRSCVKCGECAICCPAKTIDMINGRPKIELNKCIRCFCCQELCPVKAIDIKRHPIGKIMMKI